MKLVALPKNEYENYRLDVIFKAYKWDPQWYDNKTVADHVLVITEKEAAELERLTEKLSEETIRSEKVLKDQVFCGQGGPR